MLPLDDQTLERVTSGRPEWAAAHARRAFDAYTSMPMPDPKQEEWRYVEVPQGLADLLIPEGPGEPLDGDPGLDAALADPAGRALVVDGHTVHVTGGGDAEFTGLAAAIGAGADHLAAVYDEGIPADLDRFSAAHHAFGTDGVYLRAPKGAASAEPYVVEVQAVTPGAVTFPRLVVDAGAGSQVSVVVVQRSPDGLAATVVPQIEVRAGDNANVAVTTIQRWGDRMVAVGHQRLKAGRDAHVGLSEFGLGGAGARMHLTVDLEGQGSDARILGMYFGENDQTLDYRAFMNHKAPNTTSEMFLKGAVADHARSVFTGLIRIEPEGQKTNAHQTNRNLVLSEGAEAHSVPNLEILANDVRCGHGSAVGPLDEDQRYYLMSRGLDRGRADRLQVKGFFEEVLARFPLQSLEPPLRIAAMAKYDRVVARGAAS